MKGQTQAVTAILVTSVIVGSVATAYVWGVPLLEKRQSQSDLNNVEDKILTTYDTIVSVSNGGSGTTQEVNLEPPNSESETFRIRVDEKQDFIEITSGSSGTNYPMDTWTLLRGKSPQNLSFSAGSYALSGVDLPGVVAVRPAGGPSGALVSYRIEFRNMLTETSTGESLGKIDLEVQGQDRANGETTLVFSNQGTEQDIGEDAVKIGTNEELSRKRTVVEVDLR